MATVSEPATSLELFHPVIQEWFRSRFAGPTEPQERGWPHIVAGRHILIAAPTGRRKTLTAFLARSIDCSSFDVRAVPDETRVVYVSPLRALSNDMHRNLEQPLAEILRWPRRWDWMSLHSSRSADGDTTAFARAAIVTRPPHPGHDSRVAVSDADQSPKPKFFARSRP